MQTRCCLLALGLVPALLLCAWGPPQRLGAQPPVDVVSRPTGAQVQAQEQLRLLELQKRQLAEQGQAQVRELEEQEREQIEQLKSEANRQMEQVRRQVKRQIEQVRRQAKWQQELLDAQMKLVEAQAAIQPPSKEGRPTDQARGRPLSVEVGKGIRQPAVSGSLDEKLEKILERLERFEKRLDRLDKAR